MEYLWVFSPDEDGVRDTVKCIATNDIVLQ